MNHVMKQARNQTGNHTGNQDKSLWQRYGKLALLAVFLTLAISGGMQILNHQKAKLAEQASLIYEKMMASVKKEDFAGAKEQADILIKQYAKTPYSALAALMLSRVAIDNNEPKQAIELLNKALTLGKQGPLEDIARIRLARVLLSETRYQEALAILPEGTKETGYTTVYEEIRGDIYFKQNEPQKAKEAYAKALKAAPPGVPLTALQLKFTDLNVKDLNVTDPNTKDLNVTDPNVKDLNVTDQSVKDLNATDQNVTDQNVKDLNVTDPNVKDLNVTDQNVTDPNMKDQNVKEES